MDNPVVFLGGTCNDDPWREEVMKILDEYKVPYFNPVVKDWNQEAQRREEMIKKSVGTIQLYVITSRMTGVFSIAEVVASVYEDPDRTVLGVCRDGFTDSQVKSLEAVSKLVLDKGATTVVGSREFTLPSVARMVSSTWERFKLRAKSAG